MTTYKIKLVSQTNALVFIIISLAIFFGLILIIAPAGLHNKILSFGFVAIYFGIDIYCWQKFVMGKTEWTVTKERIDIIWTKKFAFSKGQDYSLRWNEILDIYKVFDPRYYILKISFKNGGTFTFYHLNMTFKDDFDNLLIALYAKLEDMKRSQTTDTSS